MAEQERITPEYKEQLLGLFKSNPKFGRGGTSFFMVTDFLSRYKVNSIIDYGCGAGTLKDRLAGSIRKIVSYDPVNPKYDVAPKYPKDATVCIDVMEHVEEEYIDAVLEHIASLAVRFSMFYISVLPAINILPDGRNAHITLKTPVEWINRLDKYFIMIEAKTRSYPKKVGLFYVGKPRKT